MAVTFVLAGMSGACTTATMDSAVSAGPLARGREAGESAAGAYLAGRYAGMNGDVSAAGRYFRAALRLRPEDGFLRQQAFVLSLADGRIAEAAELAEGILESDPGNRFARLVLALRAGEAENFAAARAYLVSTPQASGPRFVEPLVIAWLCAGEGRYDAALASLAPLAGTEAFAAFASYHAALINDLAGREAAAEAAYADTVASLSRTPARVIDAFGRFLERNGRTKQARALYTDFLAEAPAHPIVMADLERLDAGGTPERTVRNAREGAAEALYSLASILARDLEEDALIYLQLALHLHPDLDVGRLLMAELVERSGRSDAAVALYASVSPSSPLYTTALIEQALTLTRNDRTDEAVALLQEFAATHPEDRDALIALADVYRAEERFTDAAAIYDRVLSRIRTPEPQHWSLYYARGVARERLRQWEAAERDLLQALKLAPEEPSVLNYLGYSWVDQGVHLDRALQMIETAVAQRPGDGYVVDSLGWAFYRLGSYDAAVQQLERAVELVPADPIINDHLGDVYWRVGRRLEARFQWKRALSLAPEAELARAISRKLENGLAPARQPERRDAAGARPDKSAGQTARRDGAG